MSATEPIRDKSKLKALANYYLKRKSYRNYALVIVALYTALRISDVLSLTWDDVFDENTSSFRTHLTITEKKTRKERTIALNSQVLFALGMLIEERRSAFIFANNRADAKHISRVQAWRILKAAIEAIGLKGCIACHSLRKTFGYFAFKSGVSPVMLMDLYNHSSFETTKRYLGITQDDRDKVFLDMVLV